ncbi:MAG: 2-C-methyl-D-erythritol 2,4-cyclodiphosphate synthase [Thermodesulfobacteriota bacterium]
MRIGFGYDVHPLVAGRKLILGGVEIPYGRGLAGHSDADVLVHAICDSLLGALGAGDIGQHFPDHDPRFQGISSLLLLQKVGFLIAQSGYLVANLDASVIIEEPKIFPYARQMRENISQILGISLQQVNIKATTAEGLGFVGEKKGIAAYAVALLSSPK